MDYTVIHSILIVGPFKTLENIDRVVYQVLNTATSIKKEQSTVLRKILWKERLVPIKPSSVFKTTLLPLTTATVNTALESLGLFINQKGKYISYYLRIKGQNQMGKQRMHQKCLIYK